jgi:hypothetical protein
VRDLAAAGAGDRRYVQSPDRLARQDADHVLLVDERQPAGGEGRCWPRALGRRPDDDLWWPGPASCTYAAGPPMGTATGPKRRAVGPAHDDVVPDAARVVRQGWDGVGRERGTIGAVCRRLIRAREVTRPGKTIGDRRGGGGRNPPRWGRRPLARRARARARHARACAVRGRPGAVAGAAPPGPAIAPWGAVLAPRPGAMRALPLGLRGDASQPQGPSGPPPRRRL